MATWNTKDVHLFYHPSSQKWYLTDDQRNRTCDMTDHPINPGEGFTIYVAGSLGEGATLTYSGEVDKEDFPATGATLTYNMSGNIAPADMKLGDFIPSTTRGTLGYNNFYIILRSKGGSPLKVGDDAWIQENYAAKVATWNTKDVHLFYHPSSQKWYLTDDQRNRTCDMTNHPIKAGEGFTIYVAGSLSEGATLLLPSAL